MELEYTVTVGNLLTSVSLLFTAAGLFITIWRGATKRKELYAEKVRQSATSITVKLDRIEAIILSFYDEIQVLFVDADNEFSESGDVVGVRDKLYRGIAKLYADNRKALLAEEIEAAYESISVYSPSIREEFRATFKILEMLGDHESALLQQHTQIAIFEASESEDEIPSAKLGNILRKMAYDRRIALSKSLAHETSHFRNEISKFHSASDKEIFGRKVEFKPHKDRNFFLDAEPSPKLAQLSSVYCVEHPERLSGREAYFLRGIALRTKSNDPWKPLFTSETINKDGGRD